MRPAPWTVVNRSAAVARSAVRDPTITRVDGAASMGVGLPLGGQAFGAKSRRDLERAVRTGRRHVVVDQVVERRAIGETDLVVDPIDLALQQHPVAAAGEGGSSAARDF